MSAGSAVVSRKFDLDPGILVPGSAASLELLANGEAAVLDAVARNLAFPSAAGGVLDLGRIGIGASGGQGVEFKAGKTKVGFDFGAGASAGAGVYDEPDKALKALDLDDTPDLDLGFDDDATTRFLLIRAGYEASGEVEGSHPIGALGSATFGAKAAAAGVSAVLHRFDGTTGAATAIGAAVSSWRLPRHAAGSMPGAGLKIAPRTWLIAEADGSLAVNVGAQLGYDFSYIREVKAGGLAGDIGLKIDAAVKASFGFSASSRYLVVVGRETGAETLRLRLFKLKRKGVSLGLNLKAGVKGVDGFTPGKVDDLVQAVFGAHAEQAVAALAKIEKWTDPSKPIGELVAGLTTKQAYELIEAAAGIDPETAFEASRKKLADAIKLWEGLPELAQSELLGLLRGMGEDRRDALLGAVRALADDRDDLVRGALERALETKNFAQQPVGRLLFAIAGRADESLFKPSELRKLRKTSKSIVAILDDDVLRKAQAWLVDKLDLQKALDLADKDFDQFDEFLRGRLEAFLESKIDSVAAFKEARKAIGLAVRMRDEVYRQAQDAFTNRYGVEFAATWEKSTEKTALIDATFDIADPRARGLLKEVLERADYDKLIVDTAAQVEIHAAVLTHRMTRKRSLDVSLPMMNFRETSFNDSFAKLSVENEGGKLLVYELEAKDEVETTRRRASSSLSASLTAAVAAGGTLGGVRVRSREAATWLHRTRLARPRMKRKELEYYTRPFIDDFLRDKLPDPDGWYRDLDDTVEKVLGNGPETFGDVLIAFEVTIPGDAVSCWLAPAGDIDDACRRLSLAIQRELKQVVPFYYFQDPKKLRRNESAAALLVWAAMPPTTSIRKAGSSRYVFDDRQRKTMWDWPAQEMRAAMVSRPEVRENLRVEFGGLRPKLSQAGLTKHEREFADSEFEKFRALARTETGDVFLNGLMAFEAEVVAKAVSAFKAAQKFRANAATTPKKAVDELANFGAAVTTAFNRKLGATPFKSPALRSGAQLVFVAATRALIGDSKEFEPVGTMTLTVLTNAQDRTFELDDFLKGKFPDDEDIAWPPPPA